MTTPSPGSKETSVWVYVGATLGGVLIVAMICARLAFEHYKKAKQQEEQAQLEAIEDRHVRDLAERRERELEEENPEAFSRRGSHYAASSRSSNLSAPGFTTSRPGSPTNFRQTHGSHIFRQQGAGARTSRHGTPARGGGGSGDSPCVPSTPKTRKRIDLDELGVESLGESPASGSPVMTPKDSVFPAIVGALPPRAASRSPPAMSGGDSPGKLADSLEIDSITPPGATSREHIAHVPTREEEEERIRGYAATRPPSSANIDVDKPPSTSSRSA